MVLLANAGLLFAPAPHAGALFPGVTPLMVAILAAALFAEAFTSQKRIGCTLIAIGVIGIVWGAGGTIGTRQNIGHAMFIGAGFLCVNRHAIGTPDRHAKGTPLGVY